MSAYTCPPIWDESRKWERPAIDHETEEALGRELRDIANDLVEINRGLKRTFKLLRMK